ncbi:MAG: lamin tail domain-containing protein [Balneolaceae bacterium]|nr:lamin tail domain-containing protein [Balneolaceae bacterium]
MAAFIPVSGSAQSAGDVAFVGFNGDREDEIAIVSFINLTAGTNIYFRDEEWDESITSFGSGEGEITYTVPSGGISAGDVVIINPTTEAASDGGTVNETNSYNFGVSGDELYAYLGSDKDTPTTFLFAITTKSSWGANEIPSDLTDGITALPNIGGSANQDNGEYSGTRLGTISQLKSLIQYVSNEWITTNGIGDQDIEFDQTSFTLVDPPTVAFTTETFSVDENGTSIDLTVELVEASSTAVDVDVVFLSGSSTASAGDIDSYTTQTASFGSGAASGATETVTITLIDDTNFEGTERAVFRLQNNTAGSIVSPDVLTLTINDDDAPDIVINEILYDPNGDADGNGILDISDDEFIEFVNNESFDIDISGWTVYDDPILDLRHTFPSGTVIPANGALVLFGDDTVNPVGGFGGAVVQSSNESATLSLNNGGDTITLQDAEGNTVVSETYSGTQSDESITRDPDITGSFTDHSGATGSSTDFSPGTKIDGTAFGSATYAIGIRGSEGWRMISSPTSSTTFNDLFADIWTQGATGSDDPGGGDTQLSWNETTGTFTAPASMSDPMTPGKGYIVYVFEDDEFSTPGIQGGFPKVVSTDKAENNNFSIGITATDTDGGGISTDEQSTEGFNLLGNPFGTDLSVTALLDALEAADASAECKYSGMGS